MNAPRCQAKRGVLTLRLCDEPAVATCSQCQRPTCQQHLADPARPLCIACAALSPATAGKPKAPLSPNWDDDDYDDHRWVYLYRDWYYTSHHHHLMGYNRDDLRSFDTRDQGDLLPEKDSSDPASRSFLDS